MARLKQTDIADRLGVARETVSNWEREHTWPSIRDLIAFAAATGTDPGWFLAELAGPVNQQPGRPTRSDWYAPWDLNPEPADYRHDRPGDIAQLNLFCFVAEPLHLFN